MAEKFKFDTNKHKFDEANKTITCCELDIPKFTTKYTVINNKGKEKEFDFAEQTGSEWDPKTQYIYKSADGWKLIVTQDEATTKVRAAAYLNHKLNRD